MSYSFVRADNNRVNYRYRSDHVNRDKKEDDISVTKSYFSKLTYEEIQQLIEVYRIDFEMFMYDFDEFL